MANVKKALKKAAKKLTKKLSKKPEKGKKKSVSAKTPAKKAGSKSTDGKKKAPGQPETSLRATAKAPVIRVQALPSCHRPARRTSAARTELCVLLVMAFLPSGCCLG